MTKCGKTCEVYSRVVGYHRPVQNWNKGKTEEFKERVEFQENVCLNNPRAKKEIIQGVRLDSPDATSTRACACSEDDNSDFF